MEFLYFFLRKYLLRSVCFLSISLLFFPRFKLVVFIALLAGAAPFSMADADATRVARITCAVLGETKVIQSALRIQVINEARDDIGAAPYLLGDEYLRQAIQLGACEPLVISDSRGRAAVNEALAKIRDRENQRLEQERIAQEKRELVENETLEKFRLSFEESLSTDKVNFFGLVLSKKRKIVEIHSVAAGRGFEIGDRVLKIGGRKPTNENLAYFVNLDDGRRAVSVVVKRKREEKHRSIGRFGD